MASDDGKKHATTANPWAHLRSLTAARIALGRAGTSQLTKTHLDFQLAHARARNAVHHVLDVEALATALEQRGETVLQLSSAAGDRPEYLQRPDRGRRLSDPSRALLDAQNQAGKTHDVAIVIGDGLSALAIEQNAALFLDVILPMLKSAGWKIAPLSIVTGARVAIGDEIGHVFGAALAVVLIGERPGLSSPDSMGIYLTYAPKPGVTDEARNCISNVRKEGLSYEGAAHKLLFLMTEARRRKLSGVNLKDEAGELPAGESAQRRNFLIE